MRKFIYNLSFFCAPLIVFIGFVEYLYRTQPSNYTIKNYYLNKYHNDIEVLLFGDSHCFYGLNPIYFDKFTFNLSNVSQTIYFDKLLLEQHFDKLPKLKCVVFCIEYTNLSQRDDTQEDLFRKYYYQHYMELDVPLISRIDMKQYLISLAQSPKISFYMFEKLCQTGSFSDSDTKGWGTNFKKKDRIQPLLVAKQRAYLQEDGLTDFTLNSNRIKDIIKKCKSKNIKVVIVSMPQTHLYSSYLNQNKLKSIFNTCQSFQDENANSVFYLNLFNDKRFNDEDFFDSDHLNEVGAEKCSKIVNQYIN
jgi:hypothetical protein